MTKEQPYYPVGTRVILHYPFDVFPTCIVEAGQTGVVDDVSEKHMWIKLDNHHEGLDYNSIVVTDDFDFDFGIREVANKDNLSAALITQVNLGDNLVAYQMVVGPLDCYWYPTGNTLDGKPTAAIFHKDDYDTPLMWVDSPSLDDALVKFEQHLSEATDDNR